MGAALSLGFLARRGDFSCRLLSWWLASPRRTMTSAPRPALLSDVLPIAGREANAAALAGSAPNSRAMYRSALPPSWTSAEVWLVASWRPTVTAADQAQSLEADQVGGHRDGAAILDGVLVGRAHDDGDGVAGCRRQGAMRQGPWGTWHHGAVCRRRCGRLAFTIASLCAESSWSL